MDGGTNVNIYADPLSIMYARSELSEKNTTPPGVSK